jgi:guanine deaminase
MLDRVAQRGTAVAHCPLSNAYFSAEPFRLREALQDGVRVGLGTDIAGGYDVSIMSAMRHAVTVSRMREGRRIMSLLATQECIGSETADSGLSVDWKDALYLATRGGAEALGMTTGAFAVGTPFDAQQSEHESKTSGVSNTHKRTCILVNIINSQCGVGIGPIDFLDGEETGILQKMSLEAIEKWFCLGDVRNRSMVWIQGQSILPKTHD